MIATGRSADKVLDPLKGLRAKVIGEVARGAGVMLADRGLQFMTSKV